MTDLGIQEDQETVEIPVLELNRIRVLCPLGRGAKGVVFRVRVPGSDDDVALKVVLKPDDGLGRVGFERQVLSWIRHPLLPRLRGVLETEHVVGYAMDYCPGSDLDSVRQHQSEKMFSDEIIRFYGAELVLAIEHLHKLGIVYRDLKPQNILIQENGHLMLVDFDLSTKLAPRSPINRFAQPDRNSNSDLLKKKKTQCRCFNSGSSTEDSESESEPDSVRVTESGSEGKSNSFVGTEDYVAPEIIAGDGHDYAVDWWCLGVVMYEMLYGTTPFRGSDRKETFYRILSKAPDLGGETTPLRGLIGRLLEKDPTKRIQLEEIKGHEFFGAVDWEMICRIQRPPFIPPETQVEEDMEGIKQIDVESFVQGIFSSKNEESLENEGFLKNNGDKEESKNKRVWVEGSWERNDVIDVGDSGGQKNHSVEPETEPRMLHGSMATKVQIPFILLTCQTQFSNPGNNFKIVMESVSSILIF
ncbi:hypothetical protein V2J09_004944 [Rumex salicifolius]